MQRKFITNLVFLLFINLLVKPFWILGIDRKVQNMFGSEVYGEYFVLFNVTLLLNILLDLGITNFNNRNIAQNKQLLSKHFPVIIVIKFSLGLLYLGITLLYAFCFEFSEFRVKLLLLLMANQFLVSFTLYLRSNIAGLQLFRIDSMISVLDKLLMIIFCSLLIWGNVLETTFNIEWFVYAQTLAYCATAATAFIVVYTRASFSRISLNMAFMFTVIKKSLPYALLIMLMYFYNRMDTIMLDILLNDGARESGIYAQGYRLLDAINMIGFLTAGLLYPMFSLMLKEKKSTGELTRLSFGFLAAISIPVAIVSWIYSGPIIGLLYNEEIDYSAQIFKFLMNAFIPVSISYVFGTLLTANGNLKLLNVIAVLGVLMNFTLNYIFIPSFGAIGSAYTTLVTQYFASIAQIIAVLVIFKFRVNRRFLLSLVTFIAGCIAIGYSVKFLASGYMLQIILSTVLMITLAITTRLVNVKSMLHILKYERR